MDPDFDFITNILNVSSTDVEKLNVRTDADTTFYEVTLVRKPMICPYTGIKKELSIIRFLLKAKAASFSTQTVIVARYVGKP